MLAGLPETVAGFLLAALLDGVEVTRDAVVRLVTDEVLVTAVLFADAAVVLLTLLVVLVPPLVETLLVNTRSEPV